MERKISFVIPAYNEEESLSELYSRIMTNVQSCLSEGLLSDYEILFVDDGSTDHSVQVMKELHSRDDRVRYIIFRKNFGKSIALQAAFRNVTGDIIITMDADLQDEPSELRNFLLKLDEGYDMVVGWKVNRLDPMEKKLPSKLFNKVTSKMSGLKLHDFDCGYKAFRREVADSLDVYGEMHRYIPVLAYRRGFSITEIPVQHNKRKHGKSKYGMERYMRGLFDFLSVAFLSNYHDRPMYFFGKVGTDRYKTSPAAGRYADLPRRAVSVHRIYRQYACGRHGAEQLFGSSHQRESIARGRGSLHDQMDTKIAG